MIMPQMISLHDLVQGGNGNWSDKFAGVKSAVHGRTDGPAKVDDLHPSYCVAAFRHKICSVSTRLVALIMVLWFRFEWYYISTERDGERNS
jgi:hypothetical protein